MSCRHLDGLTDADGEQAYEGMVYKFPGTDQYEYTLMWNPSDYCYSLFWKTDIDGEPTIIESFKPGILALMVRVEKKPVLELGNLAGAEGNAFVILGRAQRVADDNNLDWDTIHKEAKSGDYQHLLKTMKKYFMVVTE